MTILETFIKLRNDLKLWVTNNLKEKANISYVDEKFENIDFPVDSVNGKTGVVQLTASDVGADPIGSADASLESAKADSSDKDVVVLLEAQKYTDDAIAAIPSTDGPKEFITLIDEANTCEYRVVMRNGTLVSFARATKIEVTTMPDNTSVESIDAIDLTGMVVSVIRQDGTSNPIDNYVITSTEIAEDKTYAKVNIEYTECGEAFTTYVGLGYTPFDPEVALADFTYTANEDGTYTITEWKQTLNGTTSTEMILPNSNLVVI